MDTTLCAVLKAREVLQDVTPLNADCGRFCGAACCAGDDETGMLLFPGEAPLYRDCAFGRVIPANFSLGGKPARLFVCGGSCARSERPLACRIFPLLVSPQPQGASLRMDPRSAGVCPLYGSGLSGLAPGFRDAAGRAAEILAEEPECRRFLQDLSRQLEL
ncbi:MAG: hypothetical protein IJ573_07970 [Clostridia bacterium]|nr:hypothetical protein [Clostridia bacterium]